MMIAPNFGSLVYGAKHINQCIKRDYPPLKVFDPYISKFVDQQS